MIFLQTDLGLREVLCMHASREADDIQCVQQYSTMHTKRTTLTRVSHSSWVLYSGGGQGSLITSSFRPCASVSCSKMASASVLTACCGSDGSSHHASSTTPGRAKQAKLSM